MIKWCSYCVRFIGECDPLDDFHITHGVCPSCRQKVLASSAMDKARFRELKDFFRTMQFAARAGTSADVAAITAESRRLHIPAMDFLLGILQPLLVEIGQLWASNQITVAAEHRFSAMVGDLLAQVQQDSCETAAPVAPQLLLMSAQANSHNLGLQMAEFYFASIGFPVLTVLLGLPIKEVMELLALHRPKAVGFSVALPSQMAYVQEVATRIKILANPPQFILMGGPVVRMGLKPDPESGIQVCHHLAEVLPLMGESRLAAFSGT